MPRTKRTTENLIADLVKIYGDKYDFSKVVYVKSKSKVIVVCNKHGEFMGRPDALLAGHGCPKCRYESDYANTLEEFISKAVETHGHTYDYSETVFTGISNKVNIICRKHGKFLQSPRVHIKGGGCSQCFNEDTGDRCRKDIETFICEATEIHGNKYDYSKVKYINTNTNVTVVCDIHGEFKIRPAVILRGGGCKRCADAAGVLKRRKVSTEEFISRAIEVHGNEYDYSEANVLTTNHNVCIICKEHGRFYQTPTNHLRGTSCPVCAKSGFDKNRQAFVYILKSNNMVKVGITNDPVHYRANAISKKSPEFFKVVDFFSVNGDVAQQTERDVLQVLRMVLPQPTVKFDGYTEAFVTNNTSFVVKIVESALLNNT